MRSSPLRVRSIIDAVEASLREQILDQEIPMGSVVRESEVARAFDVARPTAKTAIERLVASGLLRRDAHRSARVPALTADDVADLYFTRILIEGEIARRLAAAKDYPDTAENAITKLRALGLDASPADYVEPDISFHAFLTQQLHSPRLSRLHQGLMQEMTFCMAQVQAHQLLAPSNIAEEHARIGKAIKQGRSDAAAAAVEDHLQKASTALAGYLRDRQR